MALSNKETSRAAERAANIDYADSKNELSTEKIYEAFQRAVRESGLSLDEN